MQHPTEDGTPMPRTRLREPYVGEGVDGCLRSAQIDREEADCLDRSDPRCSEVIASAERWEQQAEIVAGGVRRPDAERGWSDGAATGPGQCRGR